LVIVASSGFPAAASDWPMVQKDSMHSGSTTEGPKAPLRKAWSANADDPEVNDTAWPVVFDGTVYASAGRSVLAVDAKTGTRRWIVSPPEGQLRVAPAVDAAGVYIPIPGNQVLALSPRTGEELWRFRAADEVSKAPIVANNRVFFGTPQGRTFYSVDAATGTTIWEVKLDMEPYTIPALSEERVVFSMQDLETEAAFLVG
jgi:outer membrane protein assembly factor BamB